MMTYRTLPALALPFALLLSAPAFAQPACSGGGYAADASIVPTDEVGTITLARQYAWDGGEELVDVCNLLTEGGDFLATWSLFSGEVDATHPGICVSLTNADGTEWFSCQTPDAVALAFAAQTATEASVLRFDTWRPEAPTLN